MIVTGLPVFFQRYLRYDTGVSTLLCCSKQFLPQRQPIGRSIVVYFLHFFAQSELVEVLIQEQEPITILAQRCSSVTDPVEQLTSDCLDLRVAIRFLVAEHMPDRWGFCILPRNGALGCNEGFAPVRKTVIYWTLPYSAEASHGLPA